MPERISGFRGEFLGEWDIAEGQLLKLADAFRSDNYQWRPDSTARSVSEVFVHIACGTFMLLEVVGTPAPVDVYPDLPREPMERLWAFVRKNDQLEHELIQKDEVIALLNRALASARQTMTHGDDASLDRERSFLGESTTVRRVYLRLLAHTHEHMGQLIGYMRACGMPVPWHDWRPDRR